MDPGGVLLGAGESLALLASVVVLAVLGAWCYEWYVERHGRPGGAPMGDAFGNLIDVFDPGQARASRELKDQQNVGPVAPVPDPDPEDPVRLVLGVDGTPTRVRIRRTDPPGT